MPPRLSADPKQEVGCSRCQRSSLNTIVRRTIVFVALDWHWIPYSLIVARVAQSSPASWRGYLSLWSSETAHPVSWGRLNFECKATCMRLFSRISQARDERMAKESEARRPFNSFVEWPLYLVSSLKSDTRCDSRDSA